MGNSTATKQGGWMLRAASRKIPICIALTTHFAILYALVYDPVVKLVVGEQPGPVFVEVVVVPSHGSTFVEQGEVAEPTSTALAELPLPTLAEEPPQEISERGEAVEKPMILPAPGPKRAAVHKASAPPVRPAVSSAPPRTSEPIMGTSGLPDQPEMGASDTNQASVGVSHAWKARLLSHLERYKRYPSEVRMKGTEGTVLLSFGMDRDGQVLQYHLVRSSGSPELDDEALAMIVRASPLPPVPPEITAQIVQLVVPVRFRM